MATPMEIGHGPSSLTKSAPGEDRDSIAPVSRTSVPRASDPEGPGVSLAFAFDELAIERIISFVLAENGVFHLSGHQAPDPV